MSELKPCPCGKIPEKLWPVPSNTSKWAFVSGTCCGEWQIEFRTQYLELTSPECMELAIKAWNDASRADK